MADFTSRQLRAMLLLGQHRSFTRAAAALFITPSGLSVLIRELETQLGFRLFDRTTRYVAPTHEGSELLAIAQRGVEDFDGAVARLGQSASASGRSLSIGAPPLIAANILPPVIHEFHRTRPGLRVELFDGNHSAIRQKIESGELHMGLGAFFGPAPGIHRTPLFRFSLMMIRGEESKARRSASSWTSLKGETLISLPPASPLQHLIDKQLKRAGIHTRPGAVLNSLDTQIAMVEAGEGIAVIPSFGLPACLHRKVIMTPLIKPVVNLEFSAIRARGRKLSPGALDFTSFLQTQIAAWAGRAGIL